MIAPGNVWAPAPYDLVQADRPDCYDHGGVEHADNWGAYFFFGGPGRSEVCR